MSGLFGKRSTISTEEPRIGALRIQQSAYGLAIPLIWGKSRLTGNLIWYGDFTAIPHTTTQSSGGKGGGGVTNSSTTYTYTAAAAVGIAEGPINGIGTVWAGKEKSSLAALGLSLFAGSYPQTPWGYLSTYHAAEALGYQGSAYAAGVLDLGGGASLPNLSFEVKGRLPFQAGTIDDANPKDIVVDFLCSANYGCGFPSAKVGDLTQYSNYCVANGIFLSPALTEQQQGQQHLADLLQATHSAPVWSEGKLKILPFGDTQVSGNGATYVPDIIPRYDLTDDDFLADGDEDPIRVIRKTTADAYNQVQIEHLDRAKDYNPSVLELKDQANVEAFGLRPMQPIKMHAICEQVIAAKVAPLILQRALYIRNEYDFRLGWRYCLLEPMDIVTLTDLKLGMNKYQVRILEVEEDEEGALSIRAEDFPFGVAHPPQIQTQTPGGYSVDFNVAPGNANTPVIFEPPIALAGQPEMWLATSGGQSWGGAEVWVSLDNATYKQVGVIHGRARHGTLTATLPSGGDPDTVNTQAVDLSVSGGTLTSGSIDDRDLYNTLCYADGELVSYATATLTAANRYDLTSLRRGAYGTPVGSHASGTKFARLDQAIFRYAYDPSLIGKTLYVKLRSFNIYGGAAQDLSALTPHTYTIAGAPLGSVGGLVLAEPFTGSACHIKWNAYPGASSYKVEVWVGGTLRRNTQNVAGTAYTYSFENAKSDGGPWRTLEFRVYAVAANGQSSSPAILGATNPQVGAPTGIQTVGAGSSLSVSAARPADTDYAGTRVWISQTSGFDPLAATPNYDGPNTYASFLGLDSGTWYLRLAHYDVFGADGLNLSSEIAVTVTGTSGGIDVVGTLPTTGLTEGRVVYLTTDEKIYRYDGTAWVTWTDGSDLLAASVTAGKMAVAELSAISADMGDLTAGTITLDAAGFLRGGQTDWATGKGFWQGYKNGEYRASMGNPAQLNTLSTSDKGSGLTVAGPLVRHPGATGWHAVRASSPFTTGKWYWEVRAASRTGVTYSEDPLMVGVGNASAVVEGTYPGANANSLAYYNGNGGTQDYRYDGAVNAYGSGTFGPNEVIGVAYDADARAITFYKNGTTQGTITIPAGLTGALFPMLGLFQQNQAAMVNFGPNFTYTAPAGYKAPRSGGYTWDGDRFVLDGDLVLRGTLWGADGIFSGDLLAARGTFAGDLSAARGTFSGSLTADAVNAVNTINIAGNAVTVPVFASVPASSYTNTHTNGQNFYLDIVSCAIDSGGSPVSLWLTTNLVCDNNGFLPPYTNYLNSYFEVWRGGSLLFQSAVNELPTAITLQDAAPPAGVNTYSLKWHIVTGPQGTNEAVTYSWSRSTLFAIATKR